MTDLRMRIMRATNSLAAVSSACPRMEVDDEDVRLGGITVELTVMRRVNWVGNALVNLLEPRNHLHENVEGRIFAIADSL